MYENIYCNKLLFFASRQPVNITHPYFASNSSVLCTSTKGISENNFNLFAFTKYNQFPAAVVDLHNKAIDANFRLAGPLWVDAPRQTINF